VKEKVPGLDTELSIELDQLQETCVRVFVRYARNLYTSLYGR